MKHWVDSKMLTSREIVTWRDNVLSIIIVIHKSDVIEYSAEIYDSSVDQIIVVNLRYYNRVNK